MASAGGASSSTAGGWSGATARLGAAPAQAATPDITTGQTITLIERDTKFHFVNVGGKGMGTGDEFIFESDLLQPGTTNKVGQLDVVCTAVFRIAQCDGSALLNGRGQLVISGGVPESTTFPIAVTGGTGDFQNARGQVDVTNTSNNTSKLVLRLIP